MLGSKDPAGHLFMKQLLKREAEAQSKEDGEAGGAGRGDTARSNPSFFADALVERLGESLVSWASSNRGAFVLSELVQVMDSTRVHQFENRVVSI